MSGQPITPELRTWILEQHGAGHSSQTILDAMIHSGWHRDVGLGALTEVLDDAGACPVIPALSAQMAALRVPDIGPGVDGPFWAHDRFVQVVVNLRHPRLLVFANVASADECAELMALAAPRLSRSETVVHETGGSEVNAARTSEGMFFNRGETALIERLEARMAALLNWPVENGEGLQVLRYGPGAEYKPHFDYFDPEQSGTAAVLRRGGQRLGTLVLYLNTPEEGGATVFPDAGLTVHALQGHAVFFSYDRPSASTGTLHGGAPVLKGEKWVATKWLRQAQFD